jgi:primosomal protein N' (replication factor Y)
MKLYEVAVVAPLHKTLTYAGPGGADEELQPGQRVLVPLGRRLAAGYILGPVHDDPAAAGAYSIKPIREILDAEPLFPAESISFYRWIADYYHYPIGEVIRTALPGGLAAGSGRRAKLKPGHAADVLNLSRQPDAGSSSWIERLAAAGELPPTAVAAIFRHPPARNLLRKMEKKGWVTIEGEIRRGRIAAKTQVEVMPGRELHSLVTGTLREDEQHFQQACERIFPGLTKPEQKTLFLIREHFRQAGDRALTRPDLTREYSGAGAALRRLADKELLSLEEKRVYRDLFGREHVRIPPPERLTDEQEEVLERLLPVVRAGSFRPFLLHGITGCGKTEVYLRVAESVLAGGKTVLVLVPEIALASQLEAHFFSRFGDRLALLHSALSTGERHDQWQRISRGEARIVIGARSAVFAPLPDLGLVIVDEEHEPSYKQEEGLHYNGRDLAVLRGRMAECPVLLGSATPSVVSYHHAMSGKYELLTMRRRVHDQVMPEVQIVNLAENKRSRPDLFLSDELVRELWENMENRQQSLLFVNRRGFASFMLCGDCGHVVQCRHCKVSLTEHRREQKLVCHYCGYRVTSRIICPECGSKEMKALGIGSERIEEEVRQVLPHARVARLDSDTAASRKQYLDILRAVYRQDVDVLVGTQMIAKGLHFPGLTLVGVVWADSGLGIPDFRSSERTFQLLAQVTGRAGRGAHPGRVVVQTYHPEHYSVLHARRHEYERFFDREIAMRREINYPPFSRLVNVRLSARDGELVESCAKQIAAFLRRAVAARSREVEILGPAPSPLVRIKDRTRWQILLKGGRSSSLHWLCGLLQERLASICKGKIRMTVDVDPENML